MASHSGREESSAATVSIFSKLQKRAPSSKRLRQEYLLVLDVEYLLAETFVFRTCIRISGALYEKISVRSRLVCWRLCRLWSVILVTYTWWTEKYKRKTLVYIFT